MSYTNAIFYMDYENGSDATRATLTTVIASNPSGTITRLTKTGHGLVTGAVVTTSLFTAWINGTWKITKFNDDAFDLDGAVWATTADTSGSVVPFGGMSWSDSWKTIYTGASSGRINPGDEIRIAKSADPVLLCSGTWTNLSKTITLDVAQTTTIDNCETAYTVANSSTVTRTAGGKQGSYYMYVRTPSSGVLTNTKYAYITITELNLSAYTKISLWLNLDVTTNTKWKICLCSDTAGDTVVDTFIIPILQSDWTAVEIIKEGGGNLGSSIKSVAIYSGSVSPGNSAVILFDNIIACTSDGLSHNTLISKNSLANGGEEGWYGIQSIDNTTVLIDNGVATTAVNGMGYYGQSEKVLTYMRKTIWCYGHSNTTTKAGSSGAYISYKGGYNITTNEQDGATFYNGCNGVYIGLDVVVASAYVSISRLNFFRYNYGITFRSPYSIVYDITTITCCYAVAFYITGHDSIVYSIGSLINSQIGLQIYATSYSCTVSGIGNICNNTSDGMVVETSYANVFLEIGYICNNAASGIKLSQTYKNKFKNIEQINNNVTGIEFADFSALNVFKNITNISNNSSYAVDFVDGYDNAIFNTTTSGSGLSPIRLRNAANCKIYNANIQETSEIIIDVLSYNKENSLFFQKYNSSATDNRMLVYGGTVVSQTDIRHTESGIAWKFTITNSIRTEYNPISMVIATVAVSANKVVTFKAWIKKDHATAVGAKLFCGSLQLSGIDSDVVGVKADNTDWEEVVLTFTPTEAGVIKIELLVYYITGNSNVYIDDLSVTQA